MRACFLALCMMIFLAAPAPAQPVVQPERGSPLRAEILNAARPVFSRDVGGPIEFVVHRLNVMGNWAFGDVYLQRPGGGQIDWRRTKYAEDFKEGMFDPGGSFFLARRAASRWTVVEFATGPTDVAWDGWRQDRHLPEALFAR
jgi:hypothetical protein